MEPVSAARALGWAVELKGRAFKWLKKKVEMEQPQDLIVSVLGCLNILVKCHKWAFESGGK